jgi:WD40 repeat protein
VGVGYSDGDGVIANLRATPIDQTPITITSDFSGVYSVAFSPDGKTMAAGGDDGITSFWTIPPPPSGLPIPGVITTISPQAAVQGVNSIAYSADGRFLAIAGEPGRLGIYDGATHASRGTKVPTYFPLSVAWSPSGGIIAAGEYDCGKFIVCAD